MDQKNILGHYDGKDYPLRGYFTTRAQAHDAFERLCKYRLRLIKMPWRVKNMPEIPRAIANYSGESWIILCDKADYESMNFLSDCFNQNVRIDARRYDSKYSPREYWESHRNELIHQAVMEYGIASARTLDLVTYEHEIGCNTFRTNVAVGLYRYYGAKVVLNICAGWGDRLIAAIAAGVKYVGVDPNIALKPGYEAIVREFADGSRDRGAVYARNRENYMFVYEPFEMARLPDLEYNFVIFGSPYFDLEVYSDLANQSDKMYPTLESWYKNFLIASTRKGFNHLTTGGIFVMVNNDIRERDHYVLRMHREICSWSFVEPLGILPYAELYMGKHLRSPQPLWIYRKK